MRGTLRALLRKLLKSRIIPADAGNTVSPTGPRAMVTDHPRGCGEHMLISSWVVVARGSSPRMRGTLWSRMASTGRAGIIPADAGNTTD